MGSLLSRESTKRTVTNHDKAVLHLKIQRDKLQMYQKKLQGIAKRETEIARQLLKEGKRDRAKLAMARKKNQENLLAKADVQLTNIQEMVESIEFTQMQQEIVQGLKVGAETLKQLQKEISAEDVDKIMEDSADAIAWHDEISHILAESLTPEDNSDIEAQLAAWEAEDLKAKLPEVPWTALPVGPESQPAEANAEAEAGNEAAPEGAGRQLVAA
eukprot:GGOE01036231.1.p2 GENE.GGOE01036231.1~~GGOE01036231.1.p2  ORF type:complete len:215 (-),score=97.21 GGOE01036231.1:157-801(-)